MEGTTRLALPIYPRLRTIADKFSRPRRRHNLGFTAAGQVRINDIAGADVLVEVNTGGSLAPDFAVRLTATALVDMTASDFIL